MPHVEPLETRLLSWLARFLRQPVGTFFRERLQVHLDEVHSEARDEELFVLDGLELYQLLDAELQRLPSGLQADTLPGHVRRVVQRLRQAGALPLAGVGRLEAEKLTRLLQTQLAAMLREREACAGAAERVLVDLTHPQVRLQDTLGGLLTGPDGPLSLMLRAGKLVSISKADKATAWPEKLLDIWLQSLSAAAMNQPLRCVVVGRNAVLRVPPQEPEAARNQLQVLLATWAEGMRWPLPLPPVVALQWLKDPQNFNALADAYEGNDFRAAAKNMDPALARTYPTLDDVLATGAFERLAQAVYAPLKVWAAQAQVEVLPDAPADDEGQDA